jgi:hypothetical protein
MTEFTNLAEHADKDKILQDLQARHTDIDRWEIAISPEEYLRRFPNVLASVQLSSNIPLRKPTMVPGGPRFKEWMLLASAVHQLWIHPRYKPNFFRALKAYSVSEPGGVTHRASEGNSVMMTKVLIQCLNAACCQTIRVKQYGQKAPYTDGFVTPLDEPADVTHKWAKWNEWDIGKSFRSKYIWLWKSSSGMRGGTKHYRVIVPGGDDYGTVRQKVKWNGRKWSVKIYPTLTHAIKSIDSHLQGRVPKTLKGVNGQVAASQRMLQALGNKDEYGLGGFRIEVSVKAPTAKAAMDMVESTSLLDPRYWLDLLPDVVCDYPMEVRLVTKKGFLANATWVYTQAMRNKIFEGVHTGAPTRLQIRVLTDVFNSLGWNPGLRPSTHSRDRNAWWNTARHARPTVYSKLWARCGNPEGVKDLFYLAKQKAPGGAIPCQMHPNDISHRYNSCGGKAGFRVRCCVKACKHALAPQALVRWIATLIRNGVIDKHGVLEPEDEGLADEESEPEDLTAVRWGRQRADDDGDADDREEDGGEVGAGILDRLERGGRAAWDSDDGSDGDDGASVDYDQQDRHSDEDDEDLASEEDRDLREWSEKFDDDEHLDLDFMPGGLVQPDDSADMFGRAGREEGADAAIAALLDQGGELNERGGGDHDYEEEEDEDIESGVSDEAEEVEESVEDEEEEDENIESGVSDEAEEDVESVEDEAEEEVESVEDGGDKAQHHRESRSLGR